MKIFEWNYEGKITIDYLKALYSKENGFRVNNHSYPAGIIINGSMRRGRCYILSGEAEFCFHNEVDEGVKIVKEGQWFDFNEGPYQIKVIGNISLDLVIIWNVKDITKNISPQHEEEEK